MVGHSSGAQGRNPIQALTLCYCLNNLFQKKLVYLKLYLCLGAFTPLNFPLYQIIQ